MIGADDLWKSILQYAIQGKLVPQDPNDEPASVLLDRIREEKQRLVEEGKIKKDKQESQIYYKDGKWFESDGIDEFEIDIPFDIPLSWKWVRLFTICEYLHRGKSPKYSNIKRYPVIAQKCNQWAGLDMSKCLFIDPESFERYDSESILKTGDILINSTGTGTCGRTGMYDESLNSYESAVVDSHVTVIRSFINAGFLYYYFAGPVFQSKVEKLSNGSTNQIELATSTIGFLLIPVPPLLEQQRIVAKLEELKPLVDRYRELERERCALDDSIADLLRKSILQYAVQGKLVPQNPNDEPASVLLDKIREEKSRLVKEGKIKNDKKESRIYRKDGKWFEYNGKSEYEIEVPFIVPDSWSWVLLFDISFVQYGFPFNSDFFNEIEGMPLIRIRNLLPGYTKTYTTEKTTNDYVVIDGELLVGMDGNFNAIIWSGGKAYMNQRVCKITPLHNYYNIYFLKEYLCYFFDNILKDVSCTTVQHLSDKQLRSIILPIPPLSEQHRIVIKLEELKLLIDRCEELGTT